MAMRDASDETRVEKLVENQWVKLIARFSIPTLIVVMGFTFNLIYQPLHNLVNKTLPDMQFQQLRLQNSIDALKTKVEGVQSNIDDKLANLATQIKENDADIDKNIKSIERLWDRKVSKP